MIMCLELGGGWEGEKGMGEGKEEMQGGKREREGQRE